MAKQPAFARVLSSLTGTVFCLLTLGVCLGALAQRKPAQDQWELAAQNPKSFLETMVKQFGWTDPVEPMKLVGPIYFVGTKGLSVWLITTSEGHILLNTGMPGSGQMIESSIRKLGFKPEDVKLMLACHAHIDHVGGHAYLKKLTGAQVVMLDSAVDLFESGGKTDFNYGQVSEFSFEAVKVDRVIRDGDSVKLGDVVLTALPTPGHTRGSTTWITNVTEGGKIYQVVFPDGTGVNPGYRVAKAPSYPGIGDDYRRTFHTLEMVKPDIWLSAHTVDYKFEAKRARALSEGVKAWVDPEGYRKWVVSQRQAFESRVDTEMSVPANN